MSSSSTSRKPNFNKSEESALKEAFIEVKHIIEAKLSNTVTKKNKEDAWQFICDRVNMHNLDVRRSTEDIKKKYTNIKSAVKADFTVMRKSCHQTGGGPPIDTNVDPLSEAFATDPSWIGISGGIQSGDPDLSPIQKVHTPSHKPRNLPYRRTMKVKSTNGSHCSNNIVILQTEVLQLQKENLLLEKEKLQLQIGLLKEVGTLKLFQLCFFQLKNVYY